MARLDEYRILQDKILHDPDVKEAWTASIRSALEDYTDKEIVYVSREAIAKHVLGRLVGTE